MSGHFSQHLARLKLEKGAGWTEDFNREYGHFRDCALIVSASELLGISKADLAQKTGVPKRIISRIAKQDESVPRDYLKTLKDFLGAKMAEAEREVQGRAEDRLGDLLARRRPQNSFADCP